MTYESPQASGVYQIRCLATGKIYVGSAVNIHNRWLQHCSSLRKGCHRNRHLQAAWNKYGEQHFVIEVLELVGVSHLLEAEQEWIDSTACIDRQVGFNIRDTAESSGSFNCQVWEGFIDPDGKEVGPITNLADFCRQRGLDNTHMVAILQGRICSHKGWTHVNARKPADIKTYTGFISPSGERTVITNLAQFSRERKLHPVKMRQVKSGQIRSHKGWTWKEEENGD